MCLIRKYSQEGIGYSLVEVNGVRHVFVSAVPHKGGTLPEQVADALETIHRVIGEHGSEGSIVHQAVFVKNLDEVETCRRLIKEFYGDQLPATSYIPQPPCQGKEVAIEAMGVGCGNHEVYIERCCEQMVLTRHSDITWVHVAHLFPEPTAAGVYNRSLVTFEKMAQMLGKRGIRYDQVIRTWLYLGDITGLEGDVERYRELNRARTDFYNHFRFGQGKTPPGLPFQVYPASTGIGTTGRGVTMGCIALATDRTDVMLVPLENPHQTSAFDYSTCYSLKSPKFARAMAVVSGDCATVFVSGTAGITESETRHVGDVEGQTDLTLDNIEALISRENFCRHGVQGMGATLKELALVRVYIKRQEDYEKTRAVCERRLGELPTVYAIGDVCRPDLLVEIEGIAMCCRS